MKVDIILEAGADPQRVRDLAVLAEQNGIHTVWSSAFAARRDPLLGLALAAEATSRVRLGYMPVSPYEQLPMKIADSLLTLNELSNGRATILLGGLGKSSMMAMGLTPERRIRAMRECIDIVRAAASGIVTSYEGEIFHAKGDYASWVSSPPPLIYLAANKEQMLRLAGECGDGVMLSDIVVPHMDEVTRHLRDGFKRADRTPADYRINNFWAWHVKRDRQTAVNEARQELVWRGALQRWHMDPFLSDEECTLVEHKWQNFLHAFLTKTHEIADVPEDIITKLLDNLTLTGGLDDIESIVARIKVLEAAGQHEIALRLHADPADAITLIGEHIVPAVA